MTTTLKADALAKGYGDLEVLRDVSFEVATGRICCVVGPTGCGKSTLLRLLLGVEKADRGTVAFPEGGLGVVFQQDALLPWRSVADNVGMPLELARVRSGDRKERVRAMLDRVGLGLVADEPVSALSGGERQFVSLARALVNGPETLVMDEPFGHLDPETRMDSETRLISWLAETGTSVIFVTHNIEEAVFLADEVVVLSPKPTVVKARVPVTLPRPRDPEDEASLELRAQITDLIRWW